MQRISKTVTYYGGATLSALMLPTIAFAQGFPNPLGNINTFQELFARILEIVAIIAVPFVVLALVYSGFLFVTAQGNKTKLEDAKKAFFWVVIGALLILGASILASAIAGTVDELQGGTDINSGAPGFRN